MKEHSWRKLEYEEGDIEVGAKLGRFGAEDWYLTISTKDNGISVRTKKHGIMPDLARKIRGVQNYWNMVNAEKLDMKLPEYEKICKFWIDLVKSAYMNDLRIHADVAKINSVPFDIREKKIVPKDWPSPIQDGIIVHFCNLWVTQVENGEYPNKTIFQLAAYDAEIFGKVDAKKSTIYVGLNPIDDFDFIWELLMNAEIIYLPDITTIADLRAIAIKRLKIE